MRPKDLSLFPGKGATGRFWRCARTFWSFCRRIQPAGRTRLSLEGLKLLKAYQRLDVEALAALRLSAAVEREVETAMREFIRHALEREARSLAFLDEVRAGVLTGAVPAR